MKAQPQGKGAAFAGFTGPELLSVVNIATALSESHPEQLPGFLSKTSIPNLGREQLELLILTALDRNQPKEALGYLADVTRYKLPSLDAGVPLYPMGLLWTARAQAMAGDATTAIKTYRQVLNDWWKTADPDFKPANDAKRELAALERNGITGPPDSTVATSSVQR